MAHTTTILTTAGRTTVVTALRSLPQEAVRGGDRTVAMMTGVGLAALGRIKQAFVVKARGSTDEAGDRWAPLKPGTIAYSRTRSRGAGGRTRTERGRDARPSRALGDRQRDRWWDLYRQGLAIYKGDKGLAARRAWAVLKREGVTTLIAKYGNRPVEILHDTGLLLNSLTPGTHSAEQVFRLGQATVTIGTSRRGALAHHRGVPGRLPQRRLWPELRRWPATWWQDMLDQVRVGLIDMAAQLARTAR